MTLKTQLHDHHAGHGRIVEFAGFEMPIWYEGIVPETIVVRNRVGVFDVSHMGRAIVKGANAETFLNFVTTNDVSALKPGQAHYSLLCNESGGIKTTSSCFDLSPSNSSSSSTRATGRKT